MANVIRRDKMKISVFILFLGATFLWTQNSQAVNTPSGGHQLTTQQKQWVQKNRPASNVQKGTTGKVGKNCNPYFPCDTKNPTNKSKGILK